MSAFPSEIDTTTFRRELVVNGQTCTYYSLVAAEEAGFVGLSRQPITVRVLAENIIRRHAEGKLENRELEDFRQWLLAPGGACEISFLPARLMMPDSSGMVMMGDLATMRDAMVDLGGDPSGIQPVLPMDFIVDHSVMVHEWGHSDAAERNMAIELSQNRERYSFLRWASQAFDNLRIFPPGTGILHQINLEYLAKIVWQKQVDGQTLLYPDSLIAMDSHTAMVNSMGVVGWGVGGFEGGSISLGEPLTITIPRVTGVRLTGKLRPGVTCTDLVLTITERMRGEDVISGFVEYFGDGAQSLSLPERATISNMTPEIGATVGLFGVDEETIRYLALTGREPQQVALVEAYCKAQRLWRDASHDEIGYHKVVDIDLNSIEPCVAGPSRPDARVPLALAPAAFRQSRPEAATRMDLAASRVGADQPTDRPLRDGDIVMAAITSCTNTSNPLVMVAAGLLARNAHARGLKPKPWVKTSLSPGSRVVADYLNKSGLQPHLDALGYHVTGFGCMSCMGNSGPLPIEIATQVKERDLTVVAVLSGNRNFDARVHPKVQVNFLASPPLVIAYALAGSIDVDLAHTPLGFDQGGQPVHLADIWPDDAEVRQVISDCIDPAMFKDRYDTVLEGSPAWRDIPFGKAGTNFDWVPSSTFIRKPPYFEGMQRSPSPLQDIHGARVLGMYGDMLSTDHISPIGAISPETPAGMYLQSLGVQPRDFVSYGSRRLNHDVMVRGTFANELIQNELTPKVKGSSTIHFPDGAWMSVFDAAERYRKDDVPLAIIAGKEYGAGSSRDWAAKGTQLLGVKFVIAESFERIHRSNLVSMGVLPLEFMDGVNRRTLELDGSETFDILGLQEEDIQPRMQLRCRVHRAGSYFGIPLLLRIDSAGEALHYRHGGIVKYAIRRQLIEQEREQEREKELATAGAGKR